MGKYWLQQHDIRPLSLARGCPEEVLQLGVKGYAPTRRAPRRWSRAAESRKPIVPGAFSKCKSTCSSVAVSVPSKGTAGP
jgi:hypothetical protein